MIRERFASLPRPARYAVILLVTLLVYALPLLNPPLITTTGSDFGGVLFTVASFVLVALGLNVVVGYAGLLDLGYVGFYAVGAYTVAILTSLHGHLSWPVVVPIAVLAAVVSGIVLGAPTLRVRGDYLAIVTLGFGEIIRIVAVNLDWLGAAAGISSIPEPPSVGLFDVPHVAWEGGQPLIDLGNQTRFFEFGVVDAIPFYWLALTMVLVILCADSLLKTSRVGRAWESTREDEDVAELMGVATFRYKLLAFAIGAAVGGLSGALFATRQGFVSPDSFKLLLSILFLAAVVVGGQGNRWGVVLGAVLVAYLPERFRFFDDWRVFTFGLALMVLAVWRPQGLLPPRRTVRARQLAAEIESLEEGAEA